MQPILFIAFDPWSEYVKNKILLGQSPKIVKKLFLLVRSTVNSGEKVQLQKGAGRVG